MIQLTDIIMFIFFISILTGVNFAAYGKQALKFSRITVSIIAASVLTLIGNIL